MCICSCWSGCAFLPLQVLKGYCSYQHQNIHKLTHNRHNTPPILKCVCMCVCSHGGVVCVCMGECTSVSIQAHLWHISMALKSLLSVAVLSRLCLRITACLLWSPEPSLKRCGPKMFYLLSELASIKLMESIQLFPFQAQMTGENTLKRS